MTASNYKILLSPTNEQDINIPIQMTWDFLDRSDSIIEYENKVLDEIINVDKDFEVARFAHNSVRSRTDINYEFYFSPSGATTANTTWDLSYLTEGFSPNQIYYFENAFKKSFFKLDLYNTTNQKTQNNYITIIIPTQQGETTGVTVGLSVLNIKTPKFKLDYLGDKEGFFVYWLKNRDFLNIDTFYMTAKFFDGKTGNFIKMMNRPQSQLTGINKVNFNQEEFFYYKVVLDYSEYTYKVYDISNPLTDVLVGGFLTPIKWYEYINP